MQRQNLKIRILDHAEIRLLEQGYRGMRVDELARDVGISKRTLYEQFRTKEEMACEALRRLTEGLDADIQHVIRAETDESAQLRAVLSLMCRRFAKARAPFFRDLGTTPSLTALMDASKTRNYAILDEILTAGIRNGRFRGDLDPRLTRMTLLAACETIVKPRALLDDQLSLDQAFSAVLDVMLNGVLGQASASPRDAGGPRPVLGPVLVSAPPPMPPSAVAPCSATADFAE